MKVWNHSDVVMVALSQPGHAQRGIILTRKITANLSTVPATGIQQFIIYYCRRKSTVRDMGIARLTYLMATIPIHSTQSVVSFRDSWHIHPMLCDRSAQSTCARHHLYIVQTTHQEYIYTPICYS